MSTSQEIKKDEPNQPVKISIYQVRLRLSTFQRYTKGLRDAASVRSIILHTCFCSLSDISQVFKKTVQTWQEYSIWDQLLDL